MSEKICVRGGRVLEPDGSSAPYRDLIIDDGAIVDIVSPEESRGVTTQIVNATDRLLIPGLVNAHTHGHGSLGRGMGDRWTLELLLNAGPWLSGKRTMEHKYIAAALNAAEMILKGCTSAYDLYFEFPAPTPEGMSSIARSGAASRSARAIAVRGSTPASRFASTISSSARTRTARASAARPRSIRPSARPVSARPSGAILRRATSISSRQTMKTASGKSQ